MKPLRLGALAEKRRIRLVTGRLLGAYLEEVNDDASLWQQK